MDIFNKIKSFGKKNLFGLIVLFFSLIIGIFCSIVLSDKNQTQLATVFLFPSIVVGLIVWSSIGISQKVFQEAVTFVSQQKDLEETEQKVIIEKLKKLKTDLVAPLKLIDTQSKIFISAHRSGKKVDKGLVLQYEQTIDDVVQKFEYINDHLIVKYKEKVSKHDDKLAAQIDSGNHYNDSLQEILDAINYFKLMKKDSSIEDYMNNLTADKEQRLTIYSEVIGNINTIYFPKLITHWLSITDDNVFLDNEESSDKID